MAVRYTGGPIQYSTTVPSDTSADFRAALDAIISLCALSKTSVTGGYKYLFQSPDGLQMKLWVQDLGDHSVQGSFIRFTPTSADETQTGQIQVIIYDGRTYEAWCNCCQFFISPFGDPGTQSFVSFACGIPALESQTGPCSGGQSVTVTNLWWSSGSGNGAFGGASNFRNSRYASGAYTAAYNSNLYVATGNTDPQSLSLIPLCTPINVDGYLSPPDTLRYITDVGLRIDALIAQGSQVFGQLWDAHLLTSLATLDSQVILTDEDSNNNPFSTTWTCWNYGNPSNPNHGGGTVLATLFLLISPVTTEIVQNWTY
jgi:hypothetical protein